MYELSNRLPVDAAALMLVALMLTGGVAFWAQSATAAIAENAASVCFDSKGSSGLVAGQGRPRGSFSSSCTRARISCV